MDGMRVEEVSREAPGKEDVHRSATGLSSSEHEPFRDPSMLLRENTSGSTRECVSFPESGGIRRPHRGLDGFVLVGPSFMAKNPIIPANGRRAEAALCRFAKAEAGILKAIWIAGQARNDRLDDRGGGASSHDPHPYGYLAVQIQQQNKDGKAIGAGGIQGCLCARSRGSRICSN